MSPNDRNNRPERQRKTRLTWKDTVPPGTPEDDPVPEDADEFRLALTRRLLTILGRPLSCSEPVCQRSKRCAGPDLRCQRDDPALRMTPEETSRLMAQVRRAIERARAEQNKSQAGSKA